jgi:hypothetical protein
MSSKLNYHSENLFEPCDHMTTLQELLRSILRSPSSVRTGPDHVGPVASIELILAEKFKKIWNT